MSIIKDIAKVSSTISVVLIVLAMASAVTSAQMVSFPMRLDITINGMPGSTCHLQIYNGSGLAVDQPSAGSSVSNVLIFGNDGSTVHYYIDGRDTGITTIFHPAEHASVTLIYPPVPSPSTNPSNGNGGSYNNGAIGQTNVTVTPTVTATPTANATITPTPTSTPIPTPTPAPSQQPQENGLPWWLLLVLIAILAIGAAAYLLWRRK
jgi:hypothetical protein